VVARNYADTAEGSRPSEITVVIADDHLVVRKGLRLLVDDQPELRVVAEAGTVDDALGKARAHRPTVLVLDLHMPGPSALKSIPSILEHAPETAIVVLTMENDPAIARTALQTGTIRVLPSLNSMKATGAMLPAPPPSPSWRLLGSDPVPRPKAKPAMATGTTVTPSRSTGAPVHGSRGHPGADSVGQRREQLITAGARQGSGLGLGHRGRSLAR
jgi:CheY-like chemotaxis protein